MSGQDVEITKGEQIKILRSMIPDFKRYFVPTEIISDLRVLLEEEKYTQIVETEKRSREEAVELLMDAVLYHKEYGLSLFIDALEQAEKPWKRFLNPLENPHAEKMCGEVQDVANKYFQFILRCLQGDIIRGLTKGELDGLLIALRQEGLIDQGDHEEVVREPLKKGALHLFNIMPRCCEDWPRKFFLAIQDVKPELLGKIDPCGESPLSKESTLACAESSQVKYRSMDIDDKSKRSTVASDDETMCKKPRISSDEELDEETLLGEGDTEMSEGDVDDLLERMVDFGVSDDEEKLDDDNEKRATPPKFTMFKFQYELAGPSLAGINNIICAPTGSGKTRVALYIVQQHLQNVTDTKQRKVIFLANKVPLVQQQFKIFDKFLSPMFKCVLSSGDSGNRDNLHLILNDYAIFVMTPKILENNLSPDKIPSLSVFSLIIFDECHNTRKGEPYNTLMKKYLDSKARGEQGLPQIVGLTASIGVEKAATVDQAKTSIFELMGNLDVKKITVVEIHKDELDSLIPKPDEKMVDLIPRTATDDVLKKSIMDNMAKIEKLLEQEFKVKEGLDDSEIASIYPLFKSCPAQRHSQKYGQWATRIRRKASSIHIPESCDTATEERRRHFIENVQRLAESLVVYNEALDVHDLTRPVDVLSYVKRLVEPRFLPSDFDPHKSSSPLEKQLCKLVEDLQAKTKKVASSTGNPNLNMLSDEVVNMMDLQEWKESRVMIFVRTRATCHALCTWLNSENVDSRLQKMKAAPFTGTAAPQEREGMTQHEQESIVEKFRSGEVKLLICTTIGQEGIDIPDCNLVIRYNHVGNEVATVQTRGRSRKKGGLSVLLAMPHIIRKEKINQRRVVIMDRAIQEVNKARQQDVHNQVSKVQSQAMLKEEMKKIASEQKKKAKKKETGFTLECRGCRKVKIDGNRIRTIDGAHHVIIGMDLVKAGDVLITPSKKARNVDNVQFTGDVLCNKEQSLKPTLLGTMMKYQDVEYIALKAESWVVLNVEKIVEKSGKWRWVDVGYKIPERMPNDVKVHLGLPVGEEDEHGGEEEGAYGGGDN